MRSLFYFMTACTMSVRYLRFAAAFAPAGVSFGVSSLKNEDNKRSSMHSYVKAPSRPFVLGYICSSSSPAPLESEVLALRTALTAAVVPRRPTSLKVLVASAFFAFFQALSVFSPSRFLNFNATAFQASPVSSARCNGWYQ